MAQTGSEAVFTVLTVSQILSMTWQYQGQTLGLWAGGAPVINPVDQFLGRVTISATQLRITGAQLQDKGNYIVQVIPSATTGLAPNSKSVQLRVFGKRKLRVPVRMRLVKCAGEEGHKQINVKDRQKRVKEGGYNQSVWFNKIVDP